MIRVIILSTSFGCADESKNNLLKHDIVQNQIHVSVF